MLDRTDVSITDGVTPLKFEIAYESQWGEDNIAQLISSHKYTSEEKRASPSWREHQKRE